MIIPCTPWQVLEEVAVYKPPTVQQPGTYSLKPAAFAEFDPLFWFRDSKKAEVCYSVCATGFAVAGEKHVRIPALPNRSSRHSWVKWSRPSLAWV